MKRITLKQQTPGSQDGFAAIVITLVVMTIVVLLVIGFVGIVNRESRSSIDQELSTQAFYAAETGVNDAAQLIAEEGDIGTIETCDEFEASDLSANKVLDDNVEYTCVLVNTRPDNLAVDSVRTDRPTTFLLKAVDENGDAVNLDTLTVHWQATDVPDVVNFPSAGSTFPDSWNFAAPVLRLALTNLVQLDRQSLVENTYTTFLRPEGATGGVSFNIPSAISSQGQIVRSRCSEATEPRFCEMTFTGIGGMTQSEEGFLLVARSIYMEADVFVAGADVNGNDVLFADQQAVIDSTGRANDVLRRVQTRVPVRNQFMIPGFGVETSKLGGVCKQYYVTPGGSGEQCLF